VDLPAPALTRFPQPETGWRRAALVAGGIAALELVALVVVALAFIAKPFADEPAATVRAGGEARAGQPSATDGALASKPAAKPAARPAAAVAELPRSKTSVLVLNGNGLTGAAAEKAIVVRSLRYRVAGVADAPRRDFPRTVVMYREGFRGEGERLAKDLGLAASRAVPLDGLRPAELDGAQVVVIVGATT